VLSIIVAIAENNVIGRDNKLIWRLPEDLKRFKAITSTGSRTIIMGRKSFQSLPKILPGREHIVLTKNSDFTINNEKVVVVHDIEELKPLINSEEEYFVIGGGQIYSLLLPHAEKMYITEVHESFEGDTYFPQFNISQWEVVNRSYNHIDEKSGVHFSYVDYVRKK
jgi:dihydrofolate reductase